MSKGKPSQFSVVRTELEDGSVIYIIVNKRTQQEVGWFNSREEASAFIFTR